MVLFGTVVCIVEGWSLVQVVQSNVAKMNEGLFLVSHAISV